MVGNKLSDLKSEINHYIGIPYFSNVGKFKTIGDNAKVGKGTAKEIAQTTIKLANLDGIKLTGLTASQIYTFQKKKHLGIDCSGLVCILLNFYQHTRLEVRKTSADMLTSSPLSQKIDIQNTATGDLVRQKSGHHVLFIIEKIDNIIYYVDSSVRGRGVRYGQFDINDDNFVYQGIFRLNTHS
jgi:predicted nucleic-acid-binding Zn-ribbon protein